MAVKKRKFPSKTNSNLNSQQNKRLLYAYWETWHKGVIALQQDWMIPFRNPSMFFNPGKRPVTELRKASPLDFGLSSGYCIHEKKLLFILNPNNYPHQIHPNETYYVAGDFNNWGHAIGNPEWALHPRTIEGIDCLTLVLEPKTFLSANSMRFKFVSQSSYWLKPPTEALNVIRDESGAYNYELHPHRTGEHRFYFNVLGDIENLGQEEILWETKTHQESCPIDFGPLLLSFQSTKPLGALAEEDHTIFRLFSPRAKTVTVFFSEHLESLEYKALPLQLSDGVVWEANYPKNLHNHYYYYSVDGKSNFLFSHFDKDFKILDPYALAAASPTGPGIIVDQSQIALSTNDNFTPPAWQDIVIWETHLRDLLKNASIDLSSTERMGFTGLIKWLKKNDCYIKQLGINAVELLPIQEFDAPSPQEYHWGYMPTNYFSPSSSYASEPKKATQIQEFQELVKTFHDQGIAVIMDVVYNHVGEPNHLLFLDKYHYFEVNPEGHLMNYSGCGNDLRAKAPMSIRLIIESLTHFLTVYNVDGFRFDLAELLGIEVLLEIEKKLKQIKPSVILIAEPWSFRGHIAHALKLTGFASWNDDYRKFIKDYVLGHGNHEAFRYFLSGSLGHLCRFPSQSVNYASSHDDMCWLDKITECAHHNAQTPTITDRRRTHLMVSMLMCSIGIPMIAQGTEILHTKEGVSNTYQRGDLNALNYQRSIQYANTFSYFKNWISFRLSDRGRLLRLEHTPEQDYMQFFFPQGSSAGLVLYNANHKSGDYQMIYAVNPHIWATSISTTNIDWSNFQQVADHERFNLDGLDAALISIENNHVILPPLSCALWVSK